MHLHPPPPSSFQPPPIILQHRQRYQNQNIAWNWAFSPNLGRKTQRPFWLKIGTYGILEVQIPNPDKNRFLDKLGLKNQNMSVWPKFNTDGISRMLIFILPLVFWISNPKFIFWANLGRKFKVVPFARKFAYRVSRGCRFLFLH